MELGHITYQCATFITMAPRLVALDFTCVGYYYARTPFFLQHDTLHPCIASLKRPCLTRKHPPPLPVSRAQHDQEQTPNHPGGGKQYPVDGECIEQCDCGTVNPCGEYVRAFFIGLRRVIQNTLPRAHPTTPTSYYPRITETDL